MTLIFYFCFCVSTDRVCRWKLQLYARSLFFLLESTIPALVVEEVSISTGSLLPPYEPPLYSRYILTVSLRDSRWLKIFHEWILLVGLRVAT
jgi:hypothetical protein